jgi:chromosomal replication initiator protein
MKNIKAALHDLFSADIGVKILDDEGYSAFPAVSRPGPGALTPTTSSPLRPSWWARPTSWPTRRPLRGGASGPNYNPLFIYGDSGLGKTHLLYAIAHVIRKREKGSKIAYVKGDDLTNELVAAIRAGPAKTAEMREKYRQADLLLVDDVQFIAGKKQTQEEFFHTFNTLYESGKQIVLTSDRPPSEMTQLEDRLLHPVRMGPAGGCGAAGF